MTREEADEFLFGGGLASLFKKAAQVSEALRRVKNATFEMWNNVRMFGEQKGVAKNLESFTNIPDKNRKIASIEDLKTLKERSSYIHKKVIYLLPIKTLNEGNQ